MILRTDHVAGGLLVLIGLSVFAMSGDLPFGTLSFPGSGFVPRILASIIILFGVLLLLRAIGESESFASIDWSDLRHAAPVAAIIAVTTSIYLIAGFAISVAALIFALLVLVERKNPLIALGYGVLLTGGAYLLFETVLKSPLPHGPLGF